MNSELLKHLHKQENYYNEQIGICDKIIKGCENKIKLIKKKKEKLSYAVSQNMKYRNKIIRNE